MVSTPYERKNGKPMKIAVLAVKACISKSILPTYGRFSRARSHIVIQVISGKIEKCDMIKNSKLGEHLFIIINNNNNTLIIIL